MFCDMKSVGLTFWLIVLFRLLTIFDKFLISFWPCFTKKKNVKTYLHIRSNTLVKLRTIAGSYEVLCLKWDILELAGFSCRHVISVKKNPPKITIFFRNKKLKKKILPILHHWAFFANWRQEPILWRYVLQPLF